MMVSLTTDFSSAAMDARGLENQTFQVLREITFHQESRAPLMSRHVLVAQSRLTLCDPWTVAHQAPLTMKFSRQEYWSGLPFPSPGDLPNPGIKPRSPALQADALTSEPPGKPEV